MREPRHRLAGDEGAALITAVLVSVVVMLLGVVAMGLAGHDTTQSANDRKRVQSAAAAEAGINYMYSAMQTAVPATLPCGDTRDLGTTPVSSYTATVTYYNSSTPVPCPNAAGVVPTQALVRSTGRGTGTAPARRMESLVNLRPVRGGALASTAIFSQTDVTLASNLQITGGTAPDADIYTNGNFTASVGDIIQGSVYAQGAATLTGSGGSAHVLKNVHAAGAVTLASGFPVRGNVISSGSSISVGGRIDGDATAVGAITPWPAPDVGGTATRFASPAPSPPPARAFPTFTFDPADWTGAGYTIHTFSSGTACIEAAAFLSTTYATLPRASRVVRVTGTCSLSIAARITMRGDLSVLVDGGITINSNSGFQSDGVASTYDMALFSGLNNVCPAGAFVMRSNTNFGSGIKAVIRTPCSATFNANGHILDGQIFAGSVSFASNSDMTYYAVFIPGTAVTSFKEDVVYTREITTL